MNNRHQLRESAMTCLYQYFLLNKDIKQIVFENSESNAIDPFLYTVTIDAVANKDFYIVKNNWDNYIKRINETLSDDWEFDRLGCVEKAILLMAASELDFETAQKPIVIDEAVTLTKKYCDEDAYKLINGVLDQL